MWLLLANFAVPFVHAAIRGCSGEDEVQQLRACACEDRG